MVEVVIAFDHVTLASARDRLPYVEDLTHTFRRGTITVLLEPRPNRSPLFLGILGLAHPIRGTITVDGVNVAQNPVSVRQQSTYVPHRSPLLSFLTVLEQVAYLIALSGRRASTHQIVTALRFNEIPDRLMRRPTSHLDSLQRTELWLATHRIRESRFVLMEDPSDDLTAREATSLARLVRDAIAPDRCIVLTTRDPDFAFRVADFTFRVDRQGFLAASAETPTLLDTVVTEPGQ